MDMTTLYLILLFVCLLLSAFFSSSEAAFLSAQKLRIRHLANTGVRGAERVSRMVEQPEKLLPTILLGNNLVNTAFAALATALFVNFLGQGRGVLAATAAVTVVLLVLGETVPKTIAIRHAERMTFLYARPLVWMERLFLPVVVFLQWVSREVANLFGGDTRAVVTEEEIKVLISVGQEVGAVESGEADMLQKVFRFGDREVREVMTPRTEIVWIERGTTLRRFLETYMEHYHTRFPVYEGSEENVAGILSVKDVVKALAQSGTSYDAPVTEVMRPVYFIPETKLIAPLFDELRQSGNQMAMVADEFGGVAGLVTLKQLIEEIVGRVGEEGQEAAEEYEAIDENTFQVDGGMGIDDANEELDLGLPEGEYETIAGFVLETLGRIPQEGDHFTHNNMRFEVTEMNGFKIEKVTVLKSPLAKEQQPN